MYRLCLLLFAAFAFGAGAVHAQEPNQLSIPEPCRVTSTEGLPALEKRKQRLERNVASATKTASKNNARAGAQEKTLRANREELLQVMFRIECVRTQLALQSGDGSARRGPVKKQVEVVEVATYYATNRNATDSTEPAKAYGAKFESSLRYGRALVTIPLTHVPGNIELPRLWRLQREPDPSKHFILKSVTPLDKDAVRREMSEKLDASSAKAILLFVHGYNLGFTEAAMRTAQLAHDLRFPGVPFFFSWPSAHQLLAYWQDEEMALLSEGLFEKLLDELSAFPATDLYIVAHSMGSRIVSSALKSRVDMGKDNKNVRELLLAAPDINADLFRAVIAPKLATMQGTRTTIYASSSDLALKASKIVHGFPRLGETTGSVFTYRGLETVDASTATQVNRAYGHFYLMDNAAVLKDVRTIIEQKSSAKQRGLFPMGREPDIFWRLN
jgi:esterase/lipase superfamily enzyme